MSGLALALPGAAVVGLVALSPDLRQGLGRALGLVAQGDFRALRDYLRSFGLWAPLVSALLMQLQALLAPIPAFPLMYANELVCGSLGGAGPCRG
jgi:uncharacterized membrane protein YdjX (TVP38/TMEM64 family)